MIVSHLLLSLGDLDLELMATLLVGLALGGLPIIKPVLTENSREKAGASMLLSGLPHL